MATFVLHPETVSVDGHLFFRAANGTLQPYWVPLGQAPAPFPITANGAAATFTPTRPADSIGGWQEESLYVIRTKILKPYGCPPDAPITVVETVEGVQQPPATYTDPSERVRVHAGAAITWPV